VDVDVDPLPPYLVRDRFDTVMIVGHRISLEQFHSAYRRRQLTSDVGLEFPTLPDDLIAVVARFCDEKRMTVDFWIEAERQAMREHESTITPFDALALRQRMSFRVSS
jgi:hypothetical protein